MRLGVLVRPDLGPEPRPLPRALVLAPSRVSTAENIYCNRGAPRARANPGRAAGRGAAGSDLRPPGSCFREVAALLRRPQPRAVSPARTLDQQTSLRLGKARLPPAGPGEKGSGFSVGGAPPGTPPLARALGTRLQ